MPVAAGFLGLRVRIPAGGMDICFQVDRSSTESGVSDYDRGAWIMRGPFPLRGGGCCAMEEGEGFILRILRNP